MLYMWPFFSKIRTETLALLILVPLAVILGLVLFNWPASEQVQPVKDNIAAPTPSVNEPGPVHGQTTAAPAMPSQPTIKLVTISAAGQNNNYQIPASSPVTVADLLSAAREQGLQFTADDYGQPLGLLVTSINGLANDQPKQKYWYLYVNGQLSSTGASATLAAPGNTVEWRYELSHE